MTVVVVKFGNAHRLLDDEERKKSQHPEIHTEIIPCWFIDNKAVKEDIHEILETYLYDGFKIEFASEKHYVLFKREKYNCPLCGKFMVRTDKKMDGETILHCPDNTGNCASGQQGYKESELK